MKRILLHIGPHKTGSTTIQRAARANRATLRQAGVVYPRAFQERLAGHHNLMFAFRDPEVATHASQRYDTPRLISAMRSTSRDLVLSTETLADGLDRTVRVCEALACDDAELTVGFFVRDRAGALLSRWQQHVKWGRVTATFPDYLQDIAATHSATALSNQHQFLTSVRRAASRLVLADFDALAHRRADLLQALLASWRPHDDLRGSTPIAVEASNISLDTAATEFLRQLHLVNLSNGRPLSPGRVFNLYLKVGRRPGKFAALVALMELATEDVRTTYEPIEPVIPQAFRDDEARVRAGLAEHFVHPEPPVTPRPKAIWSGDGPIAGLDEIHAALVELDALLRRKNR